MSYKTGDKATCKNCGQEIIHDAECGYWRHTDHKYNSSCRASHPVINAITTDELQKLYPGKKIMVYSASYDQLWELTENELSINDSGNLEIYVEN